jgi:hypothetical protein
MSQSVLARLLKNGSNAWYWEVVTDEREVLDRGVTGTLALRIPESAAA